MKITVLLLRIGLAAIVLAFSLLGGTFVYVAVGFVAWTIFGDTLPPPWYQPLQWIVPMSFGIGSFLFLFRGFNASLTNFVAKRRVDGDAADE